MSTAGKVLSVLSALLAALWLLLAASVTQLNRNGAQAVEKLQKKVDDLQKDVAAARLEVSRLVDETYNERSRAQAELVSGQAHQSGVEKARSQVLETLARVQLQLENLNATVKSAQEGSQQRLAEREAETKAKADAEALVEKLKGENGELLGQLNTLRDQFKAGLQENRELVERLGRTGGSVATRPASYRP